MSYRDLPKVSQADRQRKAPTEQESGGGVFNNLSARVSLGAAVRSPWSDGETDRDFRPRELPIYLPTLSFSHHIGKTDVIQIDFM